jgi:hypothetical protein
VQGVILEARAPHICQDVPASHHDVGLLEGDAEVPGSSEADGLDTGANTGLVQELQNGNISIKQDGVIVGMQNDSRNLQMQRMDSNSKQPAL